MKSPLPDPNWKIYKKFYQFRRGCTDPTYHAWRAYGHHGIKMYKPWLADKVGYYRFLEYVYDELGPAPTDSHCLTRKDSQGDFKPGNLCWSTVERMNNTRRNNLYITHRGLTLTQAQWCRKQGLTQNCVNIRINRLGWTVKDALELT